MTVLRGRKLNGRPWLVSAALTPSAGTSAPITGLVYVQDEARPYLATTNIGRATGWTFPSVGVGQGVVKVTITPSSSIQATGNPLFGRFYDAMSSGATSGTVGSGTLLQDSVQVATGLTNGAGQVVSIPVAASKKRYYMELSLDGATNWVRIPKSFLVGDIVGGFGRSQWGAITTQWNGADQSITDTLCPRQDATTLLLTGSNPAAIGTQVWANTGNANATGVAGAPGWGWFARQIEEYTGRACAVVSVGYNSGDNYVWVPGGGGWNNFIQCIAHCDYQFNFFLCGCNDGSSAAMHALQMEQIRAGLVTACGHDNFVFIPTAQNYYYGDGSTLPYGYYCKVMPYFAAKEAADPTRWAFCDLSLANDESVSGHMSALAAPLMTHGLAQTVIRKLAEQRGNTVRAQNGPKLGTPTRASGSDTIVVPVILGSDATGLIAYKLTYNGTNDGYVESTASSAELAQIITVRASGEVNYRQSTTGFPLVAPLAVASVTLQQSPPAVLIKLASSVMATVTDATAFEVLHGLDYYVAAKVSIAITDNVLGISSLLPNAGRFLQSTVSAPGNLTLHCPAPSPPADSLTVASLPALVVAGDYLQLTGLWAGTPLRAPVEISVDGGAYGISGAEAHIGNEQQPGAGWRARVVAPSIGSGHVINIRRAGRSSAEATTPAFTTTDVATFLRTPTASGGAGLTSAFVATALVSWQASITTSLLDASSNPVGTPGVFLPPTVTVWKDALGNPYNSLKTVQPPQWDGRAWYDNPGVLARGSDQFYWSLNNTSSSANPSPILAGLANDFTIVFIGNIQDGDVQFAFQPTPTIRVGGQGGAMSVTRGAVTVGSLPRSTYSTVQMAVFYTAATGVLEASINGAAVVSASGGTGSLTMTDLFAGGYRSVFHEFTAFSSVAPAGSADRAAIIAYANRYNIP